MLVLVFFAYTAHIVTISKYMLPMKVVYRRLLQLLQRFEKRAFPDFVVIVLRKSFILLSMKAFFGPFFNY